MKYLLFVNIITPYVQNHGGLEVSVGEPALTLGAVRSWIVVVSSNIVVKARTIITSCGSASSSSSGRAIFFMYRVKYV